MNKSLYIFSIIFKSFEKIILFLIDGSDEEYEIVEDVYDEINLVVFIFGEVKFEYFLVYILEDILILDWFELWEFYVFLGLGVWIK